MPDFISIAVVQDNRLLREALTLLLSQQPELKVVEAVCQMNLTNLRSARPDIVLLDLRSPDRHSVRVAQTLREELPQSKIVVLGLSPVLDELTAFARAGVSGLVLEDATHEELMRTLRAVANGERVLPLPLGNLSEARTSSTGESTRSAVTTSIRVTHREREVIALIGDGLSNNEIALEMNVATHTVKTHVRNIMAKLGVRSRLQIAARIYRERWIPAMSA
jgi:DNA-binding NarL/FixJ family response regulator